MSPSLGDQLTILGSDTRAHAVTETLLCLRIPTVDAFRKRHGDAWPRVLAALLSTLTKKAQEHDGTLAMVMSDGGVVRFRSGESALQCAIDLQERLNQPIEGSGAFSLPKCVIGIATGEILALPGDDAPLLLGAAVDAAMRLCDGANAGSVLLTGATFLASDLTRVSSSIGKREQRPTRAYFLDIPQRILVGFSEPVEIHSLLWQAEEERANAERPYHPVKVPGRRMEDILMEESASSRARIFGRVGTIKQERGFGFIQYYTDDDEYREIYFHIAYVIDRVPIREGDHVEFVIKPGKGGRPQACSILVMASRIQGQVEAYDAEDGVGNITIRDHDSEAITFHVFRQEVRNEEIRVNDIVEFTVASGSESEGLVALDVQLFGGRRASPHVGSGDNLRIGQAERALVTTYSAEKGYGFAKCRRNSIYVHVSELVDPEQIPAQGDLIEFEVSPGRSGTYRATDVRLVARRAELANADPALLSPCA